MDDAPSTVERAPPALDDAPSAVERAPLGIGDARLTLERAVLTLDSALGRVQGAPRGEPRAPRRLGVEPVKQVRRQGAE